jgi:hypothetical protein
VANEWQIGQAGQPKPADCRTALVPNADTPLFPFSVLVDR